MSRNAVYEKIELFPIVEHYKYIGGQYVLDQHIWCHKTKGPYITTLHVNATSQLDFYGFVFVQEEGTNSRIFVVGWHSNNRNRPTIRRYKSPTKTHPLFSLPHSQLTVKRKTMQFYRSMLFPMFLGYFYRLATELYTHFDVSPSYFLITNHHQRIVIPNPASQFEICNRREQKAK